jgi:hypothetical protein
MNAFAILKIRPPRAEILIPLPLPLTPVLAKFVKQLKNI